jgi:hypothetical protein
MADGFRVTWTVNGREVGDIGAALQGKLMAALDTAQRTLKQASKRAMDKGVTQPGKRKLRATIEATGFYKASALAKTWRGYTYDDRPDELAAAFFKTRAAVIVEAFEDGATITAKNTTYLAIPQGPAKAIVHNLNRAANRSREGGKFAKEDDPTARVAAALGTTLVPIINPATGNGVLVAASGARYTPTGRFAKRQQGQATVLFALVKQATLKRRPMGREVLKQISGSFVGDFYAALAEELPGEIEM